MVERQTTHRQAEFTTTIQLCSEMLRSKIYYWSVNIKLVGNVKIKFYGYSINDEIQIIHMQRTFIVCFYNIVSPLIHVYHSIWVLIFF